VNRQELTARIAKSAARFGFFDLVRALEQALECDAIPGDSPDHERITFSQPASLAFPTVDVPSVTAGAAKVEVAVSFLGLLGTSSPLSPEWTEEVLLGDDAHSLQAFYDVFHHRIVSYLVLAWKTHAGEAAFDAHGRDVQSARLRSMAGVDAWAAEEDDPLPPMTALGLADYQHGQPHTIDRDAAEQLLQRTFPAYGLRLETALRRSIALTTSERAKLGVRNSKLDGGLVYGARCDDEGGSVRIHVGPVGGAAYEALMPGGDAYVVIERLANRIFGGSLDVELEVHVEPEAAPTTTLGVSRASRLGVDTRYAPSHAGAVSVSVPLLSDSAAAQRTFIVHPEGT
jgi:type VI secretion system protein ImpH